MEIRQIRIFPARERGKNFGPFPPPFGRQPSNIYMFWAISAWAPHSIAGWCGAFHTKGLGLKPWGKKSFLTILSKIFVSPARLLLLLLYSCNYYIATYYYHYYYYCYLTLAGCGGRQGVSIGDKVQILKIFKPSGKLRPDRHIIKLP